MWTHTLEYKPCFWHSFYFGQPLHHVLANLFQVVQPAASLNHFETHLRKKCHRLVAVKFLLYLALLSEFYLYQSTTITQAGLVHPVRFNWKKIHFCRVKSWLSVSACRRCRVWQRPEFCFDSHVALHCLTATAPPSVLQLINGFFLCAVTASARVKRQELSLWHSGIISNTLSSWILVEQTWIIDNQKVH